MDERVRFPGIYKASCRLPVPSCPWVAWVGVRHHMGPCLLCVGSVYSRECAMGFYPLTPRLGSNFPDTFCWGRTSSPCPQHQTSGPETWLLPGWGLSPFSVSLPRAGVAASFIPSQRPGPQGLLCQSFCDGGKPYFLSSAKPRGLHRDCLLVRGCCSSSRTGERRRGDSTLSRES